MAASVVSTTRPLKEAKAAPVLVEQEGEVSVHRESVTTSSEMEAVALGPHVNIGMLETVRRLGVVEELPLQFIDSGLDNSSRRIPAW